MSKSILLIYENLEFKSLDKWNFFFEDLKKIFRNTRVFYNQKKNIKSDYDLVNFNLIKNINFIFKNFFKIIFLKNIKIEYLKNHPSFQKSYLKIIPEIFKRFYINHLYLLLKINLQKNYPSDIFIMEPKNFLYTPFIILLEILSKELSINMTFIHGAFHLDNISFYNSLERIDEGFINLFNLHKQKGVISNTAYKEILGHLDFKHQVVINKNNKIIDTNQKIDLNKKKKLIVISLSKSNNYREFYFLEDNLWIHKLKEIVNLLIKYDYQVILRPHPLDSLFKFNFENTQIYNGPIELLHSKFKIDLHLSTASHSFFDALSLKIPILIWSKKDLYSMKRVFPNIFLNDIVDLEEKIKNQDFKTYLKYYDALIQTVYDQTSIKKIKFSDLENNNFISNSVYNYFKNKYSLT